MKVKNKFFKNFAYSFVANGTSTLVSIILVLFVPKLLGRLEYAYWQLYLFYASYVGFFHFGWLDGIYLKFGGDKFDELDKSYFNSQFWMLTIMEAFFSIAIISAALFSNADADKRSVFMAVGLCCILQLPRTFLQYTMQATDKIAQYARNFLLEKIVYAALVVVLLLIGVRDFRILVGADLFGRGLTLILLIIECRAIVFRKIHITKERFKEVWSNITIGSKLMFANIAGLLLLGIIRWAIQNHWSVETFGKVSLSITASNLLMTLIGAVSIVIYPMLRNIDEKRYGSTYVKMRNSLMIPILGLLLTYYPAKALLSWWLPQYAESLNYMALLFPMCVFESKSNMLVYTYLKVMRKERTILFLNWGCVALTFVTTIITVYLLSNLDLAIASITILLGIRCTAGELIVSKYIDASVIKDMLLEWGLVIGFMSCGWFLESYHMLLGYGGLYAVYLFIKKSDLKEIIIVWKNRRQKNNAN